MVDCALHAVKAASIAAACYYTTDGAAAADAAPGGTGGRLGWTAGAAKVTHFCNTPLARGRFWGIFRGGCCILAKPAKTRHLAAQNRPK